MLEIREAKKEDLEAIVALLFDDPIGKTREKIHKDLKAYEKAFEAIRKETNNYQFVGLNGDEIVSTFQLTIIPSLTFQGKSRCQIEGVRVKKDVRGQKIGTQIFDWIKDFAQKHDCVLIQLTTNKLRNEALEFYEKQGFVNTHHGLKYIVNIES